VKTSDSRARLAVSAVVSAGLCLTGAAAFTAPSQASPAPCDTAFPVGSLVAGQEVHGLTVTSGNDPSSGAFDGSIIGVLKDGIEPGVDMVMADLDSPEIEKAGIWEGMSGSPVYDNTTGDLIGAVSYTLAWGSTTVAGITPWAQMQTYAGQEAPSTVKVPTSAARAIARATDVTAAQAAKGYTEVATPRVVAGLSQRALDRAAAAKHGKAWLPKAVAAAGQTTSDDVTADDIVPGGNLSATLSTGDITQAGIGTVTAVCNGRVVGFGHPMNFTGKAQLGLAGADTLYVQADPLGSSFKVANIGDLVGTIDQDRTLGISGSLGVIPPSVPITSTVSYTPDNGTERHRTGTSHVQEADQMAATAYYELNANHQTVLDALQPGSEDQTWEVTGHSVDGPFTFDGGNLYTSDLDVADRSSWDLPDLLWLLTNVQGVSIDSVDVSSTVTDNTSTLHIDGMQQQRGGAWKGVDKHHPVLAKAGHKVVVRLTFADGSKGAAFKVAVPKRAAGTDVRLYAFPSEGYPFEQSMPSQLSGVAKLVDTMQRNDQAQIVLTAFGRRHSITRQTTSPAAGKVVSGRKTVPVRVS
jgi:hypothetical protein